MIDNKIPFKNRLLLMKKQNIGVIKMKLIQIKYIKNQVKNIYLSVKIVIMSLKHHLIILLY